MTMLIWNEDEQTLADSAREWVDGEHPIARFRSTRDAGRTWEPEVWRELVELGWPMIGLDEDGMGLAARVAICEALGRNLVPTPIVSAWLTADLDPESDADSGEVRALCWEEAGSRADPSRVRAVVANGRLSGQKVNVADPGAATAWLVTAREIGSVGVYRVDLEHGRAVPTRRVDHRDSGTVTFDNAPATRVCGFSEFEDALDRAVLAQAAEMLGGMSSALETTLAYVKERVQFGVPIGSFQAVQHRLVDCFIQVELTRSAVMAAAREPTVPHCALAKAQAGDAYNHIARECVQFHGGIGVTDECDIGFHLKRARVADRMFGTAAWHRDRWGRAAGY